MKREIYFVGPIGQDSLFKSKRHIIETAASQYSFVVRLPPLGINQDFDLDDTVKDLEEAQLVIVDLSYERPSCYYELGLSQALKRPTAVIAEKGTHIHQAAERSSIRFYAGVDEFQGLIGSLVLELSQNT